MPAIALAHMMVGQAAFALGLATPCWQRAWMDIATPAGESLFHVFGALGRYERALIQERVRAGVRENPGGYVNLDHDHDHDHDSDAKGIP